MLDLGALPGDSEDERARKRRLTLLVVSLIPVTLLWGLTYFALGAVRSGWIPFGYSLVATGSLVHFGITRRYQIFVHSQLVLMLVLPYLLQWSLGGFVLGSAVMLWAILSPLGALSFLGPRQAVRWFVAFAVLCVASGLIEPLLRGADAPSQPGVVTTFFVMNLLMVSFFVFVVVQHFARMQLAARDESDRLLLNILPAAVAARLKRDHSLIADGFDDVTILFADIVGFTELSARIAPARLVSLLNDIFSRFDERAERHGREKIKTIGAAYRGAGGIPSARPDHHRHVAEMALDMRDALAEAARLLDEPLRIRIGIHTGPVVAGVIGTKKFTYDLWGDAVNTASRMESHGDPSTIHVTEAVHAVLKDLYIFEDRGHIVVKGKGDMRTFFLSGRRGRARLA
ncbi:MAG: adenylate/guanylate cyclase domain-containing protein [Myxococcales bacterium]|nr:adenylate/guanylate cyclase domain-containing protein [Myxococcales bacterium]